MWQCDLTDTYRNQSGNRILRTNYEPLDIPAPTLWVSPTTRWEPFDPLSTLLYTVKPYYTPITQLNPITPLLKYDIPLYPYYTPITLLHC